MTFHIMLLIYTSDYQLHQTVIQEKQQSDLWLIILRSIILVTPSTCHIQEPSKVLFMTRHLDETTPLPTTRSRWRVGILRWHFYHNETRPGLTSSFDTDTLIGDRIIDLL